MHRECFPETGWTVARRIENVFTKSKATLAGGTALALHIGHRISFDLDLFTREEFRTESIISAIKKIGLPFRVISEGEGYLVLEVGGIKCSLFKYDYPFLEKPILYQGLRIAGILDIASMKVIAISQRGTKRDFVDLYVVLQEVPFHKVAAHAVRRFGRERINPIHIGKSFVYFTDADSEPEPAYSRGKSVDWEGVKKFFRTHTKQFVLDLDAAIREAISAEKK